MDKKLSTTPKTPTNKIKSKRVFGTPERDKNVNAIPPASSRPFVRHKSIAASMPDLNASLAYSRKRLGSSRESLAASSVVNSFGLKKFETDNDDTELGLLYDKYLQTLMADVLLKKKASDNEKKILSQLASISYDRDLGKEKLVKLKAREKDIHYLTSLQNHLDNFVTQIRTDYEAFKNSSVKETLDQLRIQLEPFDFLRCQGVDLPVSPEEQKKFEDTLNNCCKSIEEISQLIQEKGENLQKVKTDLTESVEILKELESLQKNLNSSMNSLQISMIKWASQSFSDSMS